MKITKDMVIGDLVRQEPRAIPILMQHGMACVGCPASQMETLEEAAMVHMMDLDHLMTSLNSIYEDEE